MNNLTGIVGAGLMGFSKSFSSYEMLIIGRLIIGFNCGLNTSLVPMYISEIAPLTLRGGLGTVNQLGCTVGILFSQILGIQEILGTTDGWPILLGKSPRTYHVSVLIIIQICFFFFVSFLHQDFLSVRLFFNLCCSPFARNRLATCSSLLIAKKTPAQVSPKDPIIWENALINILFYNLKTALKRLRASNHVEEDIEEMRIEGK